MTEVTENAPKERKPRFSLENPGELATLESDWLKTEKGLDVTPAQVRGVLMYHGEFQKSDRRKEQVAAAREARKVEDDLRKEAKRLAKEQKAADDLAKEANKAKAEDDGVAAVAEAIESTGTVSEAPEGPGDQPATPTPAKRPSRLRPSRAKSATAKAAAEF